jgi:hypothetical protein
MPTGTTYTINGSYHINNGSAWTAISPAPQTYSYNGNVSFMDKHGKTHQMDDVLDRLEMLEQKLLVLTADPEKLEQFPSLKDAFDNYRLVERMIFGDEKE